jgi:hypothetical protein
VGCARRIQKMMTINWLTIANTIITVISIIVTLWSMFRPPRVSQQPQPTPELRQPKHTANRIKIWILRTAQSPWYFPGFIILINVCALTWNLRSTSPVTKIAVYYISSSIAGILYGLILMIVNGYAQSTRKAIEILVAEPIRKLSEGFRIISEFVGTLSKDITDIRARVISPEDAETVVKQLHELTRELQDLQTKSQQPKQKKFRK